MLNIGRITNKWFDTFLSDYRTRYWLIPQLTHRDVFILHFAFSLQYDSLLCSSILNNPFIYQCIQTLSSVHSNVCTMLLCNRLYLFRLTKKINHLFEQL